MTDLAAALARASGGCSCRSENVPCALHRDTNEASARPVPARASGFDAIQTRIKRFYLQLRGVA